ncbi:MAG: sensory transduction histidine kinase [Candidatus Methanoperedens nitroreducens]|uniref:Sensory transduction histidine kinase n=1 Tax=Candidatus Methanoperedens nitratireducens TaxID=1392998 RepID=A0A0P7ZDZ0_9EURY|nr:PAS domain S-box protein [Candidatus Methanoperedens sp. BLZ2]KAB2944775.1 MAG: PAS domain S-box protein [Candidatus Methanoperedens sp.]KPQ41725.1 MAG: sensory transduction histidine kinase [Candidatus Methanoperedens sp. BLZ1]MBZ0177064.1 PAS domain S-box protein [Candidatus Methanoperedens nitroreducens]CAG0975399.1 Response regulator SaeR [Methanosarcinales archaeon]MCX9077495.1 PAS domain S-box protein [Candidatus Methanoperedens sp.]
MSKQLRVLVVEDSKDDVLLLIRELKRGGYQPEYERVDTADAMSAALDSKKWDIIISDYVMPRFSGLSALKLLKKKEIDVPFILVSGRIGEDIAVDAMKAGAQDYIRKDDLRRLNPAIERELEEAEGRLKRKIAEEALRSLSLRYEAILSAVPDIIMEVDINKIYTWANKAGFEFFGGDVIGKEAAFYFEGEQKTYNIVQPLFAGREDVIYVGSWQRRKDGERRLLAWWCRVLKDSNGNVTGALSTGRDITDIQRGEEMLRESEKKFRAMAETSPLAIYMSAGIEQKTEYINPTFTKLFGYTLEDIPTAEKWWPVAYPDEKYRARIEEEWRTKVRQAIETKSEIEPMEVIVTCKDGSKKYISWSFISTGEQNWTFGLDLTGRKKVEEELKKYHEHLEDMVKERTAELEKKTAEVERINRLFVGRELKMSELKKRIAELETKLGDQDHHEESRSVVR